MPASLTGFMLSLSTFNNCYFFTLTLMPEFDFLTRAILEEISPATLSQVISQRFLDMQVADFFGLSTSLSEINITRRTREVEETASGE